MKGTDIFPSKYLRAADLNGKEPVVTIDRVVMETLGDESKPVVYFQGKERGLVLNKTNFTAIADLTGQEDTEDWVGCPIKLITLKVEYAGKRVPAIRIEAAEKPKAKVKPLGQRVAPVVVPEADDFAADDSDEAPF